MSVPMFSPSSYKDMKKKSWEMKKLWNLIIGLMIIIKKKPLNNWGQKNLLLGRCFLLQMNYRSALWKTLFDNYSRLLWLRKQYTACSILKSPHPCLSRNAVTIILQYIKWKQLAYQVTANLHIQLYRCTGSFKPCCFIWIVLNPFLLFLHLT